MCIHQVSIFGLLIINYAFKILKKITGTTGLPKPAVIKHLRYFSGAAFFEFAGLKEKDVILCPLPIYHANGTVLGIGGAICLGATVVLRKKFSASNFWKECINLKNILVNIFNIKTNLYSFFKRHPVQVHEFYIRWRNMPLSSQPATFGFRSPT